MAKFVNANEIKVPILTDCELKRLLNNSDEEQLMHALGYHKKSNIEENK